MKAIPLTQGKVAIVDDSDYDRVAAVKWCFSGGYAVRQVWGNGKGKAQAMARFIMGEPAGMEVDHRSMDTLDNRRDNLRVATHRQNLCNRGKQRNNTSGFKGVSWNKSAGKWVAGIKNHSKRIALGYFTDIIDAAKRYAQAARELHGEFARPTPINQTQIQ